VQRFLSLVARKDSEVCLGAFLCLVVARLFALRSELSAYLSIRTVSDLVADFNDYFWPPADFATEGRRPQRGKAAGKKDKETGRAGDEELMADG
jgi:hypothetical protein